MLNKKADGGLIAIIIIILIILFLGWVITIGNRECNSNKDCGDEYYCGSDFRCHEYPIIEKTITHVDYTRPALIIGFAILLVFLGPKVLDFLKEREKQKKEYDEKTEEVKAEDESKKNKKKKTKEEQIYYTSPTFTSSYLIKSKTKEEEKQKKFFFNNYIGFILGGLAALGMLLATKPDYIGISFFGAILLFYLVYKLWSYSLDYNLEYYLIVILSLLYIVLSLIYFSKGGLFTLIAFSFLVITFFIVKETISWVGYKKL